MPILKHKNQSLMRGVQAPTVSITGISFAWEAVALGACLQKETQAYLNGVIHIMKRLS